VHLYLKGKWKDEENLELKGVLRVDISRNVLNRSIEGDNDGTGVTRGGNGIVPINAKRKNDKRTYDLLDN
jgi:hypothetical protein